MTLQLTSLSKAQKPPRFAGAPSVARYLNSIENESPGLSRKIEKKLRVRAKRGDLAAKNKLITSNLRFVICVARDYQGQGLPLEDLIAEGNVGLIKAANRFDETRGLKFISYAVWWIRQTILEALATQARVVRLPLNKAGERSRIKRAMHRLDQQLGRLADFDEIAKDASKHKAKTHYDMTADQVRQTIVASQPILSLDEPLHDLDGTFSLYDILPSDNFPMPGERFERGAVKRGIKHVLSTLKSREAEILRLYFGLDGRPRKTLRELGEHFNLTRERVRQIKVIALRRLRHKTRLEPLRKYL